MPKLLMFKGLPASGKSTAAKQLVQEGWVRTNKDDLRATMYGDTYKRKHEKHILAERDRLIIEALKEGKDVVVDDTNLNPIHEKDLRAIAKAHGADFEVDDSFLSTPISVCIERDAARAASVGEQVIRGQFHQWIKTPPDAPQWDPALPAAVLCDIDGTLAHMVNRKPYAWHKVGEDIIDNGTGHILDGINAIGYATVFMFSGRDEVCRPETTEWLERHAIDYHQLVMRPSDAVDANGNQLKDTIIKREMFEQYIRGKYNVLFVLDDRPSVCRMWRDDLGLNVLQKGDPYFEF